jgi:hypothetical protein
MATCVLELSYKMLAYHENVKRLEDLIALLRGESDLSALLLEHLSAARRYLLGCARAEYIFSLEESKRSLAFILAGGLRNQVRQTIESLIAAESA